MKTLLVGIVFAVSLFGTIAVAGQRAREHTRNKMQRHRIHEGVQSGELTKDEARALRTQQRHIRKMERRANADGTVTGTEAARIEKAQDRASRRIHRLKHNDRSRPETGAPATPAEAPAAQ